MRKPLEKGESFPSQGVVCFSGLDAGEHLNIIEVPDGKRKAGVVGDISADVAGGESAILVIHDGSTGSILVVVVYYSVDGGTVIGVSNTEHGVLLDSVLLF